MFTRDTDTIDLCLAEVYEPRQGKLVILQYE